MMIRVKDVSLTINKQRILQEVSIQTEGGEAVGIIGGNGSGKTMLMKCICGFNRMFTGEIEVLGQRIGQDTEFPKSTGFIIEIPGFMPYLSGYENLKLLAGIRKEIGRKEIGAGEQEKSAQIFPRHETTSGACAGFDGKSPGIDIGRAFQWAGQIYGGENARSSQSGEG